MKWMPLVAALAALAGGTAAQAGRPYPEKKKCAVGGESFTHIGTASYSTYGSRPDGKPYGSWTFPMPLPVCPGNGLVMYREFTKDEIARLKPLIESAEYRAMILRDTPYFRAAWLERALVQDSDSIPWITLSASWEADGNPALKATYQRAFSDLAVAAKPAPESLEWLFLQMRAANALRELGEFDKALTLIRAIPRDGLAVDVPKATDDNYQAVRDAESRLWLKEHLPQLEAAILRRDPSSEPLDLIPFRMAIGECAQAGNGGAALPPTGFCQSDRVVEAIAKLQKDGELDEDE